MNPSTRSRALSAAPVLWSPRNLNVAAVTASRNNSWVGIIFILRAAVASANADDPAIKVRSRSKNAALGPEPATATYWPMRPGYRSRLERDGQRVDRLAGRAEQLAHGGDGVLLRAAGHQLMTQCRSNRVVVHRRGVPRAAPEHDHVLAAWFVDRDLTESTAHDLFVELGELTAHCDGAVAAAYGKQIGERALDAMRRFVDHRRARLVRNHCQSLGALA